MSQDPVVKVYSPVYRFFNLFADMFAFASMMIYLLLPLFLNVGKSPVFYFTVSILALLGSFGYLSRKIMGKASLLTNLNIVIYVIIAISTFYFFLVS